jgi:predicted transporter
MRWLLLAPLAFAFWLAITVANASVKRGWRLIGVLTSLAIGGFCILIGYWFAIDGVTQWRFTEWQGLETYQVTYPVLGWIIMVGGGLIAILGTWTALIGTKQEIELKEEMEKLEKKSKEEKG